jgi:hypothetical protein
MSLWFSGMMAKNVDGQLAIMATALVAHPTWPPRRKPERKAQDG